MEFYKSVNICCHLRRKFLCVLIISPYVCRFFCAAFSSLLSPSIFICIMIVIKMCVCLTPFSSSIAIQLNAMIVRCYFVLENLISINWYVFFFFFFSIYHSVGCKFIWHWLHCCCFLFIYKNDRFVKYI